MLRRTNPIIIVLIVFLASLLRFYHLVSVPPSLYWDEVSIGYNAYSILQTGKDEWGVNFPSIFKSFGDYKLPLYIYTVAGFEKILSPNELAVRLPSSLAGIITVISVYFLVKELLHKETVSQLTSLLLAISPWHLQFTRAGFEASFGLMFLTAAVLFFLLAMRKNIIFLFPSVVFSVACFYSYHSAALVIGALVFILVILFFRKLSSRWETLFALILGISLLAPYLPKYLSGAQERMNFTGISVANQEGELISNFVDNYLANFSFDYLFFKGDQEGRHSVKKIGELYLWQLPVVLIGSYFLLRKRSKATLIIFSWALLSAVPVALTRVSPHALRNLMATLPWQIISVFGLVFLFSHVRNIWRYLFVVVFVYSFLTYIHQYYVHYPVSYAGDWQDGQKQAVTYLKKFEKNYAEIFLTKDLYPIYLEFFLPYDPKKLQQSSHNETRFGKFKYANLNQNPPKDFPNKTALVITPAWMGSAILKPLPPIKMTTGDTAFRVYEY